MILGDSGSRADSANQGVDSSAATAGERGTSKRTDRAAAARERLLRATLRCAIRDGGGAVSLQAIAHDAAVSKALVLYHYRDKDALLAATIEWLTSRVIEREEQAIARSTANNVLEDYWKWLEGEVERGELRALLELCEVRSGAARAAVEHAARRRVAQGEQTVARVFGLLALAPKLPTALLASCELAFRDGLVLSASMAPEHSTRVAFDVFWLSLLSLTN